MPEFQIHIEVVFDGDVIVEANSLEHAKQMADHMEFNEDTFLADAVPTDCRVLDVKQINNDENL